MSTETLIPNGAGSETALQNNVKNSANWENIDDAVGSPDDGTTLVKNDGSAAWFRDLYALPISSGSGTISKITVHFRCWKQADASSTHACKAVIKSNETVTEGDLKSFAADQTWENFTQEWNVNPADSQAWEWADIDALEIGITLANGEGADLNDFIKCTQVYVVVEYGEVSYRRRVIIGSYLLGLLNICKNFLSQFIF